MSAAQDTALNVQAIGHEIRISLPIEGNPSILITLRAAQKTIDTIAWAIKKAEEDTITQQRGTGAGLNQPKS